MGKERSSSDGCASACPASACFASDIDSLTLTLTLTLTFVITHGCFCMRRTG